MLFKVVSWVVLTKVFKSELFSCLPKVDHVIKSCKEPIHDKEAKSIILGTKKKKGEPLEKARMFFRVLGFSVSSHLRTGRRSFIDPNIL